MLKVYFLSLGLLLVTLIAIVVAKVSADDCDGTVVNAVSACLTAGQDCASKTVATCTGSIGLYNIQNLSITRASAH
jgi:hypothetical protein